MIKPQIMFFWQKRYAQRLLIESSGQKKLTA